MAHGLGIESIYMRKNYNHTRQKLYLPEYGRHIHKMVDHLMTIEDREERNKQAHAVIAVMGNLQPTLRDTADFTHKLWDHLFMMSDFQLDVDSPYDRPTRETLTVTPSRLKYPQERIVFKHYGKYVARILQELRKEDNREALNVCIDSLARYMRSKSFEFNQEHPNNEIIIKDIKYLSDNGIEIDEVALNNLRSDYKNHLSARTQKSAQRTQQKNVAKNTPQRGKVQNQKTTNSATSKHNSQK